MRGRTVTIAALATAFAWWATGLPPFSGTATVAVVGAGAVAMVAGARYLPPRVRPRLRVADAAPWVVLFGALVLLQVSAYLQHPRPEHPTLSYLINAALETHVARTTAFVGWLAGCVRLARR